MKKCAEMALAYVVVVSLFLGAAWFGSRTVTVMAQKEAADHASVVVIDAGHGGEDGGAVSCTGIKEKEINLEISLRLNDLLHLLGCRTRMIRTTDVSVCTEGDTVAQRKASDLKARVRMVEELNTPVLVSIHQNLFPDARYSGAQVFHGPAGEGQTIAETLQTVFRDTLNPGSHRQIKKADGIYLMEHVTCPAVLIECGFLSNPQEESKLRTPDYQKNICIVIATQTANFLDCQT